MGRGARLPAVVPSATAGARHALPPVVPDPPLPRRTAALLTRKGGYRSAAMRAFIDYALARRPEIRSSGGSQARGGASPEGE
ncbi:hypothetical protein WJ33_22675 [Burkholderia ubonensis]|uniref:LysR family transcriptional regulator n=1 Tax=Burkholderia ubonensis TaxID=101571 RepID=A0A124RBZ1_9BURK|nr:hypothetical protein WJ33_22675 [Burkholderia ubonensis]